MAYEVTYKAGVATVSRKGSILFFLFNLKKARTEKQHLETLTQSSFDGILFFFFLLSYR